MIERNRDNGVIVVGSDAQIADTVVRQAATKPDGTGGRGVEIEDRPTGPILCGCPDAKVACRVESDGLTPPAAL